MSNSVLVFVSHSSDDKEDYIEPIVRDLEDCYINIWIDKRKILPGNNLRKSIFRDGLDKADIALIFFTEQSLKSSWVDREIKHVLREEMKKGNNFDLNKIISIFDSQRTYDEINDRYPELTDDLLHLMPKNYSKIELGQLISAIWSKHLDLQGGDIETQRQLLAKDREIFQKDKEIQELNSNFENNKSKTSLEEKEFETLFQSGKLTNFINAREKMLSTPIEADKGRGYDLSNAIAFGLMEKKSYYFIISNKGRNFYKWLLLNNHIS